MPFSIAPNNTLGLVTDQKWMLKLIDGKLRGNFLMGISSWHCLKPLTIFFLNLFLIALGFPCYARAFSSCGQWGLLFVVVRGLLIAVASLVMEHGL